MHPVPLLRARCHGHLRQWQDRIRVLRITLVGRTELFWPISKTTPQNQKNILDAGKSVISSPRIADTRTYLILVTMGIVGTCGEFKRAVVQVLLVVPRILNMLRVLYCTCGYVPV